MATTEVLRPSSPGGKHNKRALSPDECPFSKRVRLSDNASTSTGHSSETAVTALPPLSLWPDDIIIHLLEFLDIRTLESFYFTCKRIHFFIHRDLQRLLASKIPSVHEYREIEAMLDARSQVISDTPPKYSFRYIHAIDTYCNYFHTICSLANPVRKCPRKFIHPDVDFDAFRREHLDLFRNSHCFYFALPFNHVLHFWTIFWEYKRVKKIEPVRYKEIVAKWAWERYSFSDILGAARFNGCYYSRLITSSLNCQRDALRMVLEIYKSRDQTCDIWAAKDGIPYLSWNRSLTRISESEYRTGQAHPNIEAITVKIPINVKVSAMITPRESTSVHSFTTELSLLDRILSQLADFHNVYNATIDRAWETRNMEKTVEFQEYFDFVWGDLMGEKAAEIMSDDVQKILESELVL